MYFVKYGKQYLHDPVDSKCVLTDLSLDTSENSAGFCDFTIHPTHPLYGQLKERDYQNLIEVYEDDRRLFGGFIYELGKDFQMSGAVKCRGELSILAESIVRPYSTMVRGYGDKAPSTIDGYFEWLIEQHNKQVDSFKQFKIGVNQGKLFSPEKDSNNYIYRESNQYPNTWTEMKEKLLDSLGGFVRVYWKNGVRYIDLIYEWTDTNAQIMEFGVNLTDYSDTENSDQVVSFVIPLGAKLKDTRYPYADGYVQTQDPTPVEGKQYYTKDAHGYSSCFDLKSFSAGVRYYEYNENYDEADLNITIEELADGEINRTEYVKKGDCIYSKKSVEKYGWIGKLYTNEDVTIKENLVIRAIADLKQSLSPVKTLELRAVDMHMINPDMKPVQIGEYVRVRSKPHAFDSYLLCTNVTLDLNQPENSTYVFGTTYNTLTGEQSKKIKKLNSEMNTSYDATTKLSEKAKQDALGAAQTAAGARDVADSVSGIAERAQQAAEDATERADGAQATANTANGTANAANAAAQNAATNASEARQIAALKNRTYLEQPTPPYDSGDIWVRKEIVQNE